MPELNEARKGQIAHAVLKHVLKEQGFELDASFRRRVGNIAKQTGFGFQELLVYLTGTVGEILAEIAKVGEKLTDEEQSQYEHDHGHGFGRGGH